MVFFTCSHCGDSVRKNKVEKHYQTVCSRNPISVTCVDCCKDFSAETYTAHTKCISEEEKYSAKGFQPKPSANKGEKKQQRWQEVIQAVKETYSKDLKYDERVILDILVKHENVPRKRVKFQNFLRSLLKNQYKSAAVDSVFDKIEAESKQDSEKHDESRQLNESKLDDSQELNETKEDKIDADSVVPSEEPEEKLSKKERKEKRKRNETKEDKTDVDMADVKEPSEEQLSKKEKKEKRKSKETKENNNDTDMVVVEEEPPEEQPVEKLSKKERKEKRKRAKYEAELKEIQANQIIEEKEEEIENEAQSKKKSKRKMKENGTGDTDLNGIAEEGKEEKKSKKKRKHGEESNMEGNDTNEESPKKKKKMMAEENGITEEEEQKSKNLKMNGTTKIDTCETDELENDEKSKKSKKKNKKGKKEMVEDEPNEEPCEKKTKNIESEENNDEDKSGKIKFNWQEIIIKILNSKEEKEMSLKRLRKKVLAELEAFGCGSATDEKNIAKFNKKVNHTPGVVVLKDNAKLVAQK